MYDVDGTLVDSQASICHAMASAFVSCGHTAPTREQTLGIVGRSLTEAVGDLAPEMDAASNAEIVAAYRQTAISLRETGRFKAPLYDGAKRHVRNMSRIGPAVLGIATGKARRGVNHMVAEHELDGIFTTVQTADMHPSKPHPSMLETACSQTGISPDNAIMIGDTSFDMEMARAAGMMAIGVTWGYHSRERLQAAGAVHLVGDFEGLENLLSEITGLRP